MAIPTALSTAKQWRKHAEDARSVAAGLKDDNMRLVMLAIAGSYDKLGAWAAVREAETSIPKGTR